MHACTMTFCFPDSHTTTTGKLNWTTDNVADGMHACTHARMHACSTVLAKLINIHGYIVLSSRIHYRNQKLCRVPEAFGEALKTLDKSFLPVTLGKEGSANSASAKPPLPSVFCRALGKTLCRVPDSTRQRKVAVTAPGDGDGYFAECLL
jgi:hypothetical protein